ncbi:leucine-rich single-pass membrane protein 1-like [Scyliorhinus canicula]|uniref:leucine-rich single-pass membrane protein 1-like n=1 Tax=Scyliorhinus canicula TaxID=7830 RepID=UPI0018F79843|nr:leucine-rich single-pass membrane protein 1-like [Scyliorhinus canicula]XP_038637178.1 leucine-rich single-pass membrane protein 1-like [Scyliorhinus canicula]XP_038637179.1 leucine-rich single-pass membrane protein 1-like [Scyliorhinus canicula]
MKMQNGFKDLTIFDLEGESKLYVVDSINNLHRANTCEDPRDPSSNPAECGSIVEETEAPTKGLLKDNGKKEPEAGPAAIKSTEVDPPPCSWHLKKIFLLAAVIVLLLVSFVLAAFAIFFIVRMENQLDYISTRVASEEQSIKEIKILMMNHFNFSKELNSSNVVGISPLSSTQSP